jgi:hypothetical protein
VLIEFFFSQIQYEIVVAVAANDAACNTHRGDLRCRQWR